VESAVTPLRRTAGVGLANTAETRVKVMKDSMTFVTDYNGPQEEGGDEEDEE